MKFKKMITPKGYLKLKHGKMLFLYPCANCSTKVRKGWMPLSNQYGWTVICDSCYKKGYRLNKRFGVVKRYKVK